MYCFCKENLVSLLVEVSGMQTFKEVSLDNLIKGFESDLSVLNEYFFYCIRNSLNSRGITFDISLLYGKSEFLTDVAEDITPVISNDFLKSFVFVENTEGVALRVDNTLELLPEGTESSLYSSAMVDNVLCNFLGEYAVRLLLKEESRPLTVFLGGLYSSSSSTHIKFYSSKNVVTWLKEFVSLVTVQEPQVKMDLELEVVLTKALYLKTLRQYDVSERLKYFKEVYPVGTIGVLFDRELGKGRVDMTRIPIGYISSQRIVEVTGYTETGFTYRSYNCYKTKTEVRRQFYQISEDKQDAFLDMLEPTVSVISGSQSFFDTSVDWLIAPFDTYMFCKFDKNEVVEKEFILNNEVKRVKMSAPMALFMLLKEYRVQFNEALFKSMYTIKDVDNVF